MTETEVLDWLAANRETLPTPLYLYDTQALRVARDRLAACLPVGAQLFYSVKANPQPGIVGRFAELGVKPEIASLGERHMCIVGGVSPADIVFGGVSKSARCMDIACTAGAHAIVVDSIAEWRRLQAAIRASSARPRVLLRIAPGVSTGGLDMAGASQFGLGSEDAVAIARECATSGAEFLGLHFYFGSQRLKPEPILKTIEIAAELLTAFQAAGPKVQVVDVGLGCGVPYLEKDTALDYAVLSEQAARLWSGQAWRDIAVCSEAGRALVAASGYFVARVTETKQLHGRRFAFLDGGINVHNPGIGLGRLFRSNPRFGFISAAAAQPAMAFDVVGNLCTSADKLGTDVAAPALAPGDLVVIPNCGAYTHTTGMWSFNSQPGFQEALLERDGTMTMLEPQYRHWIEAYRNAPA